MAPHHSCCNSDWQLRTLQHARHDLSAQNQGGDAAPQPLRRLAAVQPRQEPCSHGNSGNMNACWRGSREAHAAFEHLSRLQIDMQSVRAGPLKKQQQHRAPRSRAAIELSSAASVGAAGVGCAAEAACAVTSRSPRSSDLWPGRLLCHACRQRVCRTASLSTGRLLRVCLPQKAGTGRHCWKCEQDGALTALAWRKGAEGRVMSPNAPQRTLMLLLVISEIELSIEARHRQH